MGVSASLPMYAVEDVPGKGKGLIATMDIPQGTRIVSEKPVITVGRPIANMEQLEDCIYQQVSSLSKDQIREFLSLSNVYPYTNSAERWRGIFPNERPTCRVGFRCWRCIPESMSDQSRL